MLKSYDLAARISCAAFIGEESIAIDISVISS